MAGHVRRGRRAGLMALAALMFLVAAACSSKDDANDAADDSAGAGTQVTSDPAEVLGEPNEATGSPITIGVVTDGLSDTPDSAPLQDTVNATVEYVNEYLGGINGHVIEVEECVTEGTPAGATQCGTQMVGADVAAVLVPVSIQDQAIFDGLAGSGIPYFTYNSAATSVLLDPGAFLLTNPISQIAVPGLVAQEEGVDEVGLIVIDVPAATGPITQIAEPIYDNLGIGLQIAPIAPSVADMTPQIQEAISGGAGVFAVTGTDDFLINAFNALHQLGYEGTIATTALSPAVIEGVTDGVDGFVGTGAATDDPSDEDVQLYNAILETYAPDAEPNTGTPGSVAVVLAFVRALTGATDAVDAPSISAALSTMEAADLPLGGGITFQCGTAPVSFAPNICSTDVVRWTYGPDGERTDVGVLEVPADVLTLG